MHANDRSFKQDRQRGDRPHEDKFNPPRVVHDGAAPILPIPRR
jgi:hypothetical protein